LVSLDELVFPQTLDLSGPVSVPSDEVYESLQRSNGGAKYIATGIFGGRLGKGISNFNTLMTWQIGGQEL
jgi:hypothetical protein